MRNEVAVTFDLRNLEENQSVGTPPTMAAIYAISFTTRSKEQRKVMFVVLCFQFSHFYVTSGSQ